MTVIIDIWQHEARGDGTSAILPDGCRDVIVVEKPGLAPELMLTELQHETDYPRIAAGTRMTGFRLRPGCWLDTAQLQTEFAARQPDTRELAALIEDMVQPLGNLTEALARLSESGGSVRQVADDLGVSTQSLQRLMRRNGLPPPEFWLMLARARQSGRAIAGATALPEIAYDHGYADQAHMSREIRRWFGVSPRALRASPALTGQLITPGFAS
ncbi:MAG: helix-turn-helix transcriptional regulator [Maritimibacter sp.]